MQKTVLKMVFEGKPGKSGGKTSSCWVSRNSTGPWQKEPKQAGRFLGSAVEIWSSEGRWYVVCWLWLTNLHPAQPWITFPYASKDLQWKITRELIPLAVYLAEEASNPKVWQERYGLAAWFMPPHVRGRFGFLVLLLPAEWRLCSLKRTWICKAAWYVRLQLLLLCCFLHLKGFLLFYIFSLQSNPLVSDQRLSTFY